jgi:hypothetical protein
MGLAVALAAPTIAPVAAFEVMTLAGTTGDYTVLDAPGAVCHYENNPGKANDELDRINIKKVKTFGPFPQKSWVGFRFVIQKNKPPYNDGKFKPVFKSPIRKVRASKNEEVAFTGRFKTQEATKSKYRVKLVFYYYEVGSKKRLAGVVRGIVEVYRHRLNANNSYHTGKLGRAGGCHRLYKHS